MHEKISNCFKDLFLAHKNENIAAGVILPEKIHVTRGKQVRRQPVQGFSLSILFNILKTNRFQVDWQCLDKLGYLFFTSIIHSVLSGCESRRFSMEIDSTKLAAPPIFLIGHWRNGTTFLHNLMCRDPNHTFLRTYQALAPGSFLFSDVQKFAGRMDPIIPIKKRPMDNVKFGVYEPAEDEFAMAALTGISPYMEVLFPIKYGKESDYKYPDFRNEQEKELWGKAFVYLLKKLTVFENKRIVLKSPPHTARIKTLLELFPDARFVHIIRNPYDVFPSNLKLWRDAFSLSFLQTVNNNEIIEIILSNYEQMYKRFHEEKSLIPDSNFVEIRFEDLEKDPLGRMRFIYDRLGLPDFDIFSSYASAHIKSLGNYKKNIFRLSPSIKKRIRKKWLQTFDIYGYDI